MPLFKRKRLYTRIYADRIEITNLENGKTVSGRPERSYSVKRIVIADFNRIDLLMRKLINELLPKKGLLPPQMKILMQQMEEVDGGLVEIEKRALRDLAAMAGASEARLVTHTRKLSDPEALLEFTLDNNY